MAGLGAILALVNGEMMMVRVDPPQEEINAVLDYHVARYRQEMEQREYWPNRVSAYSEAYRATTIHAVTALYQMGIDIISCGEMWRGALKAAGFDNPSGMVTLRTVKERH